MMALDKSPQITVIIDVEESFDWAGPIPPSASSLDALGDLNPAVDICSRYGIKPALMITYPVAVSEIGKRVLAPLIDADRCLLGAQLHPWETPPLTESREASNTYPCNLPRALEAVKLDNLLDAIRKNFGINPEVYRAGRYGLDWSRTDVLSERGIKVDTSIMPHASYREDAGGPDFFGLPDEPFWLKRDRKLLALPSTQGLLGPLGRLLAPSAHRALLSPAAQRWALPAVLSRLNLLERIRLSPEGSDLAAQRRLIDSRLEAGKQHFVLSFHSPSLVPGNTPYTKTPADVRAFLQRLDGTLSYLIRDKQAVPVSCLDIYRAQREELIQQQTLVLSEIPSRVMPERILMVSGFMPPRAPMGAVRPAALLQHWKRQGVEVRTIALDLTDERHSADKGEEHVSYLPHRPPGTWTSALTRWLRRHSGSEGGGPGSPSGGSTGAEIRTHGLRQLYRGLVTFPDRYRRWIRPAVNAGLRLAGDWHPDLIYSSGPPQCGHVVASRLARRLKVPWIAEQRDLWIGNPYEERHPLIAPLYDSYGKQTLARAAGAVVVTEGAARQLRGVYDGPVAISLNGYTEDDFDGLDTIEPYDLEKLTVLHAGVIYAGRRDPGPLFAAVARSGFQDRIRCLFFHDAEDQVAALAARWGVSAAVEIHPAVPHREMLLLERQVDLLLECRWTDPSADGVIPGKLFEYIGARRPVLSLGSPTAEAAEIARNQNLGLVSNDPDEIAAFLDQLWRAKQPTGRVPDLNNPTAHLFARRPQFAKIDAMIGHILRQKGQARP